MDTLAALEHWLEPLVAQLQPAARRQLARHLATELRRSQAARIARQRNPDGSAYAPRAKPRPGPAAQERARVQAMFAKLRTARHLKASGTPESAAVQILGRAARIAAVHQYGLLDRPSPGGPEVQYPRRELLGFTEADVEMVRDTLLAALAA